jgi:SAM-dependent methyltransferase
MGERWNHNIHYHRILLDALPERCDRVLDVGCREGTLARALRARTSRVVGIRRDEASIALVHPSDGNAIDSVLADFLTHPLAPGSFDSVVSVATFHHLDAAPL